MLQGKTPLKLVRIWYNITRNAVKYYKTSGETWSLTLLAIWEYVTAKKKSYFSLFVARYTIQTLLFPPIQRVQYPIL